MCHRCTSPLFSARRSSWLRCHWLPASSPRVAPRALIQSKPCEANEINDQKSTIGNSMNDLRFAVRQFFKNTAFTAIAVLTLGLGIGANSAVFALINGLLVRPLPYHDSSGLVLLWEQFPAQGLERIPVSAPEYLDYEKQTHSFERIAAFNSATFKWKTGDLPERVQGAVVSPSIFPLLGVEPIKGRAFAQEEFGEGRDDVVVISERLWKRRFNSDPALIGNKLYLNGRSYTVIGIMPARFEFPLLLFNIQGMQFTEQADIWKPIAFTKSELESRGSRSYGVIARLRAGASLSGAQAEVSTITADWKRQHPDNYGEFGSFGAKIYPLQQQVVGGMRDGLIILLGAVALVLLVACANLATMLLARASARERFSRDRKRNSVRINSGTGERQTGVDRGFERRRSRINYPRAAKSGAQRTGDRRSCAGIGSVGWGRVAYEELYASISSQPRVRFTKRPDDGTRIAAAEIPAGAECRRPWRDSNNQLLHRGAATHRELVRSRTRGDCLRAPSERIEQRFVVRNRRPQCKPRKGFTRRGNSRNNSRLFSRAAHAATTRPFFCRLRHSGLFEGCYHQSCLRAEVLA